MKIRRFVGLVRFSPRVWFVSFCFSAVYGGKQLVGVIDRHQIREYNGILPEDVLYFFLDGAKSFKVPILVNREVT